MPTHQLAGSTRSIVAARSGRAHSSRLSSQAARFIGIPLSSAPEANGRIEAQAMRGAMNSYAAARGRSAGGAPAFQRRYARHGPRGSIMRRAKAGLPRILSTPTQSDPHVEPQP